MQSQPSLTPAVLHRVLGRDTSLFAAAIDKARPSLATELCGAKVLVIGAAGSIGSAMVRELQAWQPECLDLVDSDENGLVELVRLAHAMGQPFPVSSVFATLDFMGPEFAALLRTRPRYDFVLNFAALKHVRSESDPFTAMRMLRINALAHREIIAHLAAQPPRRYFVVSTDKAVRPVSLLGVSKALMEQIALAENARVPFGSARFANVAFSRGSLLDGFLQRIQRGEPLSGPSDVRRYFISAAEAAHLCLLGCCVVPAGSIVVPLQPGRLPPRSFPDIAREVLEYFGYTAFACSSADEAVRFAKVRAANDRRWPCFFSPSNTSGEKELEEFVAPDEDHTPDPATGVTIVQPAKAPPANLAAAGCEIDRLLAAGTWTRDDLMRAVRIAVPAFEHRDALTSLYHKL